MGQKDRNYKILAACFSDMRRVCENLVQAVREIYIPLSLIDDSYPLSSRVECNNGSSLWQLLSCRLLWACLGRTGWQRVYLPWRWDNPACRYIEPIEGILLSSSIEPINWTNFLYKFRANTAKNSVRKRWRYSVMQLSIWAPWRRMCTISR